MVRIALIVLPCLPIIWPIISLSAEISKTVVFSISFVSVETSFGFETIDLRI